MKNIYSTLSMMAIGAVSLAQTISLEHLSTYHTGVFDEGAAEIVTYDSTSNQLFFSNANDNSIGILDFSNPDSLVLVDEISMNPYGDGVNSVSAYKGNIAVAVQVDGTDGKIVFFSASGTFLSQVTVGNLPDMVTFTHDGMKVLAACEGEPDGDWIFDPVGSIAIIDVSGGLSNLSQANVTMLGFDGVTMPGGVRVFGPDAIYAIEENFQDTAAELNSFTTYNELSAGTWYYDNYNDDYFAEANGYGDDTASIDWLISEVVDLSTFEEAYVSFYSARNFSGGTLDLLISADYDGAGDPTTATWDTLTAQAAWSAGGYVDTASGDIDITSYVGGSAAIAFLYTSTGNGGGDGALWQIDDIMLFGSHGVESNIEPEYIAVSADDSKAFVSLQENNAVAVVDLVSMTISEIQPLGYKDHSVAGYGLDASDKDDTINIATWPVRGLYQPDAIASYTVGGTTYYVTANEGDARDYDAYVEEERIKDIDLDPTAFPNASTLQEDENIGRLNITISMGDTDGDGDFDELYSYGARSFTIWDANGNLVWDSGDEFEVKTAEAYPNDFNSGNDENVDFEGRSDNKGPEPEAVEIAMINGEYYAFVGLERMGGVMMYNINNPMAPTFVQYINNRDFSVEDVTTPAVGDLGVEDVLHISDANTTTGEAYIVTSNEISGTVSVFKINGVTGINEVKTASFNVFPNPATDILRVSEKANYTVKDMTGRSVFNAYTNTIDVSNLTPGVYFISNAEGATNTFVKH